MSSQAFGGSLAKIPLVMAYKRWVRELSRPLIRQGKCQLPDKTANIICHATNVPFAKHVPPFCQQPYTQCNAHHQHNVLSPFLFTLLQKGQQKQQNSGLLDATAGGNSSYLCGAGIDNLAARTHENGWQVLRALQRSSRRSSTGLKCFSLLNWERS